MSVHRALHSLSALGVLLACALLVAMPTASAKEGSRYRAPATGKLGVIATESPAAARVGRRVLERGGNAIDAAVSTAFVLNAARPQSCGIGGGGFLVYRGADGRTAALDFREKAPSRFTPDVFKRTGLHETFTGHLAVGVPGTVAGLNAALRRYGTIGLSEAIRPAQTLARRGVRVSPSLAKASADNAERLALFSAAKRQFLPGGKPLEAGALLRQPDLARTLGLIRRDGPKAFYRGEIARRIVADMNATRRQPIAGDAARLIRRDLARYQAKWRRPLIGSYRGRRIVTMPPPTSGGVAILQMLNVLEGLGLRKAGKSSADSLHSIIEAQKLAFADRGEYVADPDFVKVPTRRLISKSYAARRRALIDPARAGSYKPGLGDRAQIAGAEKRGEGTTTHLSVIDRAGNAVALTCTIEQEFGSAVVAPGTGFLLNNEMTDFGEPGSANQPQAGKRPRSSMAPLIAVQNGRPIAVVGGAGGSRIIMGVLFAALNRIEFGRDLAHAIDDERLDARGVPMGDPILVEGARLAAGVLADLRARGHVFEDEGEYAERPRVQAVGFAGRRGKQKLAVSDSRTDFASLAERPRHRRR